METIVVKYIECDTNIILDPTKIEAKTTTFRVYNETKFDELKMAACLFFKKIDQSFSLKDEYFNNLSAVAITIQEFYKQDYEPLNEERLAIVYLVSSSLRTT